MTTRLFDFHTYAQSNRACRESTQHINGIRTFFVHFHGRAILDQGHRFSAYISLIIEFKGILMKLKNVPHTISVE